MNKELKKLTEELLNEVAIIGQPYRKNKEVYDAAFKKGLEIWERKPLRKVYNLPVIQKRIITSKRKLFN